VDELRTIAQFAADAVGGPSKDAEVLADSLVDAALSGHGSHGIVPAASLYRADQDWYHERLTKTEVVRDNGAVVVLDGQDGIGQIIALEAMNLAVEQPISTG